MLAHSVDGTRGCRSRFDVRAACGRWVAVGLYAIAMAYVEAAAVLYLRTILGGIDPVGPRHTPFDPVPDFGWIEIGREAATLVMLLAVGWLAGRGVGGRLGAFALAFGLWDIFYYVFLWLFVGWPSSLLAPDVLFLIPLPWWGPVLSPVLVAGVIVVAGGLAMARELGDGLVSLQRLDWLAVGLGVCLCLGAFMANALLALPRGVEAAYFVRGGPFPWLIYAVGIGLGVFGLARGLGRTAH